MTTSYGNNILMPFDCFIDIDYGLLMLIKNNYSNPNIIYKHILNHEQYIPYYLVNREEENPLSIVMKEQYKDKQDKFRDEFIKKEYDNILNLSKPNDILNLIKLMCLSSSISIDILCKNDKEEKIVKKALSEFNTNIIINDDLSKINISKYDSIFIKNYKDILLYKNLAMKNIYALDYNFNKELDLNKKIRPIITIEGIIGNKNTTSLIEPYDLSGLEIYG